MEDAALEHCFQAYIVPRLDAVSLWLLAGTAHAPRAWVEAHVERVMRAMGWFAAPVRNSYTPEMYLARHGTLFWKLFACFGRRHADKALTVHDTVDEQQRQFRTTWAYAFFRFPSVGVLMVAGPQLVRATYAHYTGDCVTSLMRWCLEDAPSQPAEDVFGVLDWLQKHACLLPEVVVGQSLWHPMGNIGLPMSVFNNSESGMDMGDSPMTYWVLTLLTGHLELVRSFDIDITIARRISSLLAAILSKSTAVVDHCLERIGCRIPVPPEPPRLDVPPGLQRADTSVLWTTALCTTDAMCVHLLARGLCSPLSFDTCLRQYAERPGADMLSRALRFAPDPDVLGTLLKHLVREPVHVFNTALVMWARDAGYMRDEDMAERVMPFLAHHAFQNMTQERAQAMTDADLEAKFTERCDCTGHAVASMLRRAGFKNVVFTRDMVMHVAEEYDRRRREQRAREPGLADMRQWRNVQAFLPNENALNRRAEQRQIDYRDLIAAYDQRPLFPDENGPRPVQPTFEEHMRRVMDGLGDAEDDRLFTLHGAAQRHFGPDIQLFTRQEAAELMQRPNFPMRDRGDAEDEAAARAQLAEAVERLHGPNIQVRDHGVRNEAQVDLHVPGPAGVPRIARHDIRPLDDPNDGPLDLEFARRAVEVMNQPSPDPSSSSSSDDEDDLSSGSSDDEDDPSSSGDDEATVWRREHNDAAMTEAIRRIGNTVRDTSNAEEEEDA